MLRLWFCRETRDGSFQANPTSGGRTRGRRRGGRRGWRRGGGRRPGRHVEQEERVSRGPPWGGSKEEGGTQPWGGGRRGGHIEPSWRRFSQPASPSEKTAVETVEVGGALLVEKQCLQRGEFYTPFTFLLLVPPPFPRPPQTLSSSSFFFFFPLVYFKGSTLGAHCCSSSYSCLSSRMKSEAPDTSFHSWEQTSWLGFSRGAAWSWTLQGCWRYASFFFFFFLRFLCVWVILPGVFAEGDVVAFYSWASVCVCASISCCHCV